MEEIQDPVQFFRFIERTDVQGCLVDFYAKWCGPCMKLAPILEQMREEYPLIAFAKVDCDESEMSDIVAANKIESLPTIGFYRNGKYFSRVAGFDPDSVRSVLDTMV